MQNNWAEITDWTAAYDNRAAVPTHEEFFYAWGRDGAAYREENPPEVQAYSEGARQHIDVFRPEGTPKGLIVFIHGGWWSYFGREYFSHLAKGAVARGWAVSIPSYTLCPDIRISGIVRQMGDAVVQSCAMIPDGPLVICGHSAGGHLTAMLATEEASLHEAAASRLKRIVPISGVADLRPLMHTAMNETLGIDTEEARTASPLFLTPRKGFDCLAWVGGDETPEFRRQNALLASAWGAMMQMQRVEAAGLNHFDVIAPLAEADSDLTKAVTLS